jgi:hypothetical protein
MYIAVNVKYQLFLSDFNETRHEVFYFGSVITNGAGGVGEAMAKQGVAWPMSGHIVLEVTSRWMPKLQPVNQTGCSNA